ncbi:MAG: class I tRNA ligase family protein [Bacteroidota bacterium]
MEYNHKQIEEQWQQFWADNKIYNVKEDTSKPKYYVLDMFPYPSGAGLHVGHPLGYIASDIYSRYKRLKGYNVLHPMGYDAFGLPAEQYAIQTGQHPAITTEVNIKRYREQLNKIGFSYDWDREVRTSNSDYYKWTQWIFIKLFHSWYNPKTDKAEPIETLIRIFEIKGFHGVDDTILNGGIEMDFATFKGEEWKQFSEEKKQKILLGFRLAYLSDTYVNWCPALGTVLSNDEIKDGVSERGGHPVERKLMKQWSMKITAYAERLLQDLNELDWTESIKEAQRNWIGKSVGSSVEFKIQNTTLSLEVFTTRPDTIFGVSFIAIAPEHDMLSELVDADYMDDVTTYVEEAKNRSERDRQADVKRISGQFTGMYAIHPFTEKEVPIWVADYVLAGYGTGAVMGVAAHDTRDFAFAKHFNLPIPQVVIPATPESLETHNYTSLSEPFDAKEGILINSSFLNGLSVKDAIKRAIEEIEKRGIGKGKTNYRLRDAIFGRQRYWGEPIPVYYKDGLPYTIDESELPLILPEVDKYLPTEDGEPPLARANNWKYQGKYDYELSTMPGWAGSSWYFLRYMDNKNTEEFVGNVAKDYWKQVDLYIGGSEHATGHLLYVRFWTKFLYDMGLISIKEPAKKLINQGMIQGLTNYLHTGLEKNNQFEIIGWNDNIQGNDNEIGRGEVKIDNEIYEISDKNAQWLVPIEYTDGKGRLYEEKFNLFVSFSQFDTNLRRLYGYEEKKTDRFNWNLDGERRYLVLKQEVEKMSKSKYNVVTPDDIIEEYGADTLRLYEMFLGPLEQSKPWSTQGIEGVHRFLKKLWRLFYNDNALLVSNEEPSKQELKALHKLIKKVGEDIENFSFNTSVPAFMICVNELSDLKCNKRAILSDLLVCLSPYAPHISEELWQNALGNSSSIVTAEFPFFNPDYLVESSFSYPISINGKHRENIEFALDANPADVEATVLANETVQKWLEGKTPKKVIFVKGKIVNIVV